MIGNYILENTNIQLNGLPIGEIISGEYANLEEYVKISVYEDLQDVKPPASIIAPIVLRIGIDILNYDVRKPTVILKLNKIIGKTPFSRL